MVPVRKPRPRGEYAATVTPNSFDAAITIIRIAVQ